VGVEADTITTPLGASVNLNDFTRRADELLSLADRTLETQLKAVHGQVFVDRELHGNFRSSGMSFLLQTFGSDHPYFREFDAKVNYATPSCIMVGKGILAAAKEEVSGGWIQTTIGIVSAAIFSDFLEMSEHLLTEGYKDPAAVMIGGVLEEHLRQLARKHGLPTEGIVNGKAIPKKADALNADLTKAGVYNLLDQKMITAWLDLRNKAAHGKYGEYIKEQVELMLQGINQFMVRVPV
jgi:hypothetical protein